MRLANDATCKSLIISIALVNAIGRNTSTSAVTVQQSKQHVHVRTGALVLLNGHTKYPLYPTGVKLLVTAARIRLLYPPGPSLQILLSSCAVNLIRYQTTVENPQTGGQLWLIESENAM